MDIRKRAIYIIALVWLIISLMQSAFTGLIHDEAYYWFYSQDLSWGYFDHPPAVALFIWLGDHLSHSEWGLRLFTILSSALGLLLLWELVKPYGKRPWLFFLLFLSMPLITAFSFLTVPDVPLLLGMILYLLLYREWLLKRDVLSTVLLGVSMAFLLYSKYHGVLVIGFTVLSHWSLLRDRKFWLAGLVGLFLFLPHILWQFDHDFVSFRFHLQQRSKAWEWSMTVNYLLTQLLIISPLVSLPIIFRKGFWKMEGPWERALGYQMIGTLLFFLIMSFRGPSEGNWTLIVELVLIVLIYRYVVRSDFITTHRWYLALLSLSVLLIQLVRVQFFVPLIPNIQGVMQEVHTDDAQFLTLAERAQGKPIIFMNTYQFPARYMYHTGEIASCHTSFYYRPNQFNLNERLMDYSDTVLLFGAWPSELGGKYTDSLLLEPYREFKINPRLGYTSYLGLAVRINTIYDRRLEVNVQGDWPELGEKCYFWMIEHQADRSTHHIALEEAPRRNGTFTLDIPELREGTEAISICVGPEGLYPEPNGYIFSVQ